MVDDYMERLEQRYKELLEGFSATDISIGEKLEHFNRLIDGGEAYAEMIDFHAETGLQKSKATMHFTTPEGLDRKTIQVRSLLNCPHEFGLFCQADPYKSPLSKQSHSSIDLYDSIPQLLELTLTYSFDTSVFKNEFGESRPSGHRFQTTTTVRLSESNQLVGILLTKPIIETEAHFALWDLNRRGRSWLAKKIGSHIFRDVGIQKDWYPLMRFVTDIEIKLLKAVNGLMPNEVKDERAQAFIQYWESFLRGTEYGKKVRVPVEINRFYSVLQDG